MTATLSHVVSRNGRANVSFRLSSLAIAAALLTVGAGNNLSAQWTGGPTGPVYYNGGNVGIGTTNPSTQLHIYKNQSAVTAIAIDNDSGTVGVGQGVDFNYGALGTIAGVQHYYNGHWNMGFKVWNGAATEMLTIQDTGNVGIGTTNPQNKLSVAGTVQAYEVVVNTGWSDYVFAPNYRLAPLKAVAAYIEQNHHLPGIPSAAEVEEKGVSLGEMQSKLLAKVEELTLHMIQADERNDRLERQNRELQERIIRVEAHPVVGEDK